MLGSRQSHLHMAEPLLFWFIGFPLIFHFQTILKSYHPLHSHLQHTDTPPPTHKHTHMLNYYDFDELWLYLLSSVCGLFPLSIF